MQTILFVCEHGAAKSVVAAAHFNRLARERGLAATAISRGTDPDAVVHPAAEAGLAAERLQPGEPAPRLLTQDDLDSAAHVVTFCDLPVGLRAQAPVERWSVPPVSEDYATSRAAIVVEIERLLPALALQR